MEQKSDHGLTKCVEKMRRFAFRAWNKKKNQWQHKEPCDLLGEMIVLGGWMNKVSIRDFDDIIIMQVTGLFDKNKKEVCEGDLVRSDSHEPPIYVVKFQEGGFCCVHGDLWPIDINHFWPSIGCQLEVIGNIFDNPEIVPIST